jgi:hypothetical protein
MLQVSAWGNERDNQNLRLGFGVFPKQPFFNRLLGVIPREGDGIQIVNRAASLLQSELNSAETLAESKAATDPETSNESPPLAAT